jgi:hypothetical protein
MLQEWCVNGMTLIGWAGYGVYGGFLGRYDWIEAFLRTIYEPPRIKYRRDVIGRLIANAPNFKILGANTTRSMSAKDVTCGSMRHIVHFDLVCTYGKHRKSRCLR